MIRRVSTLMLLLLAATVLTSGCAYDRKTTATSPTSPTGTGSTSSTYVGTWSSNVAATPIAADACGNFQWKITNQTATSIAGDFSALCAAFTVAGTGAGQLNGQDVSLAASGTVSGGGVQVCSFALTATGTIQGDTLPLTYSGTICGGAVHGTETLRRGGGNTPIVINAPTPVSPSGNVIVGSTQPTLIVTNATVTGPAGPIAYRFQVTQDVAFASNVLAWQVPEQANQTSLAVPQALSASATYFWRAQAYDGSTTGPWSAIQTFSTPSPSAPPPSPSPSSGSFDLSRAVIVVGPKNFASWPETARITAISQGGGMLCIDHTMLGRWPRTVFFDDPNTLIEGNQWYFALINGTWYGGAGEWVRPGQSCKAFGGGPEEFYDVNQEPLHSWNPRPGDLVGIASSTPARVWPQLRTSDERTNVEMVRWQ